MSSADRDRKAARAILAYRAKDLAMQRFFAAGSVDPDTVNQVANALEDHDGPVRPGELRDETRLTAGRLTAVVNLLGQVDAVRTTDNGRIEATGEPAARAAQQAVELSDAHQQMERSRVEMMRDYAETMKCRRRFLLGYFGQEHSDECGTCDRCVAADRARRDDSEGPDVLSGTGGPVDGPADDSCADEEHPFRPGTCVLHAQWGNGSVMSTDDGQVSVLTVS
ncbi:RecQ family zinc-binding domain-containing protein [Actinacidiphila alni]|uniref:RecQ family zinc-binding domain-containing protein n=1 Tax=Actinacidiphila alni TaxID=380248 RepID=UPI0034556FD3